MKELISLGKTAKWKITGQFAEKMRIFCDEDKQLDMDQWSKFVPAAVRAKLRNRKTAFEQQLKDSARQVFGQVAVSNYQSVLS